MSVPKKKVEFFTHRMCPYAQRVWFALEEKAIDYKLTEIDLYGHRPQWFMQLNPKGLVPVIRCNSDVVTESNDILDYLDQFPLAASVQQGWSVVEWRAFIDNELGPAAKTVKLSRHGAEQFRDVLSELESQIVGPFLTGEAPCGADYSLLPFLFRIFDNRDEFNLAEIDIPKMDAYAELALNLESFRKTVVEPYWWWW